MALSSLSEASSPSIGNDKASELPQKSPVQHESSLKLENDAPARILLSHFTGFDAAFEVELAAKIASCSSAPENSKRSKIISPPTLLFSSLPHLDEHAPANLPSNQQDSDLPETQRDVSPTSSSKTVIFHLHPDPLLPGTQIGTVGSSQLPNGYGIESDSRLPDTQRMVPNQLASREGTSFCLNPGMLLPDTQVGTVGTSQIPNGCGIMRDSQMPETQGDVPKYLVHSSTSPRFNFDILLHDTQTDSRSFASSSKFDEKSQTPISTCDPVGSSISSKDTASFQALQASDSLLLDTQISSALSKSVNTRVEATKDVGLQETQRDSQVSDVQIQRQLPHKKSQAANRSDAVSTSTEYPIIISDDDLDIQNENSSPLSPSPSHSSPTSAPKARKARKNKSDLQHEDPFILENTSSSVPSINSSPSKQPANKLTVQERKRIVVSSERSPTVTTSMRLWIRTTHHLLDPFRSDDECWLHPSPPRAHLSVRGILRPCGKLQKRFVWQNRQGRHSLVLNYGIVSKLVYHKMSKQQIDGFVNKHWHLSHLCGNWTCVNPEHTTVEPGSVNISRNNCFSHRSGCLHTPPCMKEMKVPLGADGKLVDHNASVASYEVRADEGDDWSVMSFEDGEGSFVMDGDEDEQFSEDEANGDGLGAGVEIDDF